MCFGSHVLGQIPGLCQSAGSCRVYLGRKSGVVDRLNVEEVEEVVHVGKSDAAIADNGFERGEEVLVLLLDCEELGRFVEAVSAVGPDGAVNPCYLEEMR